jgi:hypothetical protein
MRDTTEIFIPIPKTRNTHCRVLIEDADVTTSVKKSKWIIPCTIGIGTFNMTLSNSFGKLNGLYNRGDTARFYADNLDGNTLQFYGIIDFIKNNISDGGQFLEIEGRHRAYLLNETLICYSTASNLTSEILKSIVDKLPASYGFTYTNVTTTSDSMDAEWNYKPFWDCVVEICNFAGYDSYIDNDLDFHYFEENSIANSNDAIVEGDNFLETKDWGTNSLYEKTRVTAMGQDDEGLPILYTAISANEGTDIKEIFIKDTSANTETKVQNIADAKLAEVTNKNPQAIIRSFGLETVKPGDNIWIIVPRQQISGQYKIIQITHEFGQESGGWRTECVIEEEDVGIPNIIQNIAKTSNLITQSDNVNKLNYSFNFTFDVDSGTHSTTEITEGVLKTDGSASGTWISQVKALSQDATEFELRVIGESLPGTTYYVSSDNGLNWQEVTTLKTKYNFSPTGQNLKIKVILNSASTQIKSLALLYS